MVAQPLGADRLLEKRNENKRLVLKPGIFPGTTSKAQWCTGEKAHQTSHRTVFVGFLFYKPNLAAL